MTANPRISAVASRFAVGRSSDFDLVIAPGQARVRYWKDLWDYRELFYFLAWRDVLVRYKQTVLGVVWSVFKPLLTMAILTLVFGKLARLPSGDVPYPIMVFAGLLAWQFFTNALSDSSNALLASAHMVTKVYFPRLLVPASAAIVSLIDFVISFAVLLLLMWWYQFAPSVRIIAVVPLLALTFAAAFGCGCLFGALNVRYRDFRFIVPFIAQFGLYISPIGFSSTIVPERWRLVYSLNPMVGIIDGFRWAILGGEQPLDRRALLLSVAITAGLVVAGISYFRRAERSFADVI